MKAFARQLFLITVIISSGLPTIHLFSQNKQGAYLEQRVEFLEQKVKILESRMSMILGGKGEEIKKVNRIMLQDFTNIARLAHEYYLRSNINAVRTKSYRGFVLLPRVAQTELANYSVTPRDSEVTIEGKPVVFEATMGARVGVDGKLKDWTYTGDFSAMHDLGVATNSDYDRNWEAFNNQLSYIAALAYQYRVLARSAGGGGGSFAGFILPHENALTPDGRFRVVRADASLVIEGIPGSQNLVKQVLVDSMGKIQKSITNNFSGQMKKVVGGPMTAVDSTREIVTADFAKLAARAFEFRKLPATEGGGAGKYTGYLSAQIASYDGRAEYKIDVNPDWILLTAVSTRGLGTISTKIDSNGKLTGWYYTGELSE